VPVHLAPLRERKEDIELLVAWFAETFCRDNNYRPKRFEADALEVLRGLPWRGNARELRNAVERLIIMTPGDSIGTSDIPAGLSMPLGTAEPRPPGDALIVPQAGATLQSFKDAAERAFILAKLEENDWNIAATAKAIDTPRSNLYKKLEAYGIARDRE
jgi:two-component system nitrogen regulation response regulator NtrX